jgi:hypothetical protein
MTTTLRAVPAQILPPAPAHVRLGWKQPVRVAPEIAQARMLKRVVQWEALTDDHIKFSDGESESIAPVVVLKSGQSLGKTVTVLNAVAKRPGQRGFYAAQTTDLAREIAEKAGKKGVAVELYRGRSQVCPGTGSPMCAKHEIAATVAALGMPVATTLCRKKLESGEIVECPFAASCEYLAQAERVKTASLIVAAHQYLSLPMDALKDVDYVIVDESFWQSMTATRRVDLGRFLTHRAVGKRFKGNRQKIEEAEFELGEAVETVKAILKECRRENRQMRLSDFRARGWTAEFCEYLKGLEYSRVSDDIGLDPSQTTAEQASILKDAEAQEALAFARVWRSIGIELATKRNGKFNSVRIVMGHKNPKTGELQNVILCHYRRKSQFADKPTLILDANADSWILKKFYPSLSMFRTEAAWSAAMTFRQTFDTEMSTTTLKENAARQDETFNMGLFMAKRHKAQIAAAPKGEDRRPLIIAPKAIMDVFREQTDMDAEDAPFRIEHYNNTRGKDGFKHSVAVGVVGRVQPSTEALEDLARCLSADSDDELQFIEPDAEGRNPLPRCQHYIEAKDGSREEIAVSYHPDPFIHRILLQIREAEIMQSLTRARPVWRDPANPCEMFAVTNVPLPVVPDSIHRRSEMMPDRFDMMWLAGFLPEQSQDIAAAFPDLFGSAGVVRTAACRRGRRAFPIVDGSAGMGGVTKSYIESYKQNVTGAIRVSFDRPTSAGGRGGSAWMELEDGDTRETVIARVRQFLPDAEDFSFAMPEPIDAPEAANDNAPGQKRHFVRFISRATLLLAQNSAYEAPWWTLKPRGPDIFSERRAA